MLGQNVAKADTPGYRPRDLEPAGFEGLLGSSAPTGAARAGALTSPALCRRPAAAARPFRRRSRSDEVTPSGNGVDLPEQMRKMAATELDHQLATSLYRRYVGMLRTALGVPAGLTRPG